MIYLDNASTTKIDSRVLDKMLPYLTERYGNPGNLHSLGKASKEAIDRARGQVAEMIGAQPENIIFTSGGSEANTLVFRGLSDLFLDKDLYSVATSNVEHKSVLRAADALYSRRVIQVSPDGSVSLQAVKDVCDEYDDIALVSVMHTNNETGSVSDVKAIAEFCNSRGILFHTDCVQAAGFSKLDVKEIGCDFMSISAHKIHGAKGVGALYVRDPSLLNPVIFGGDAQEFGIRGGTENVAGIVGFGYACQLISEGIATESNMMSCLCKLLQDSLLNNAIDKYGNHIAKVNGQIDADRRILNICFHGIDAETLLMALDSRGIAVSAGAACNNNESHPSYVLTNMGLSDEDAMSSIRLSLSRETSYADVVTAASEIVDIIKVLAQ